jgi:hypothetical protein
VVVQHVQRDAGAVEGVASGSAAAHAAVSLLPRTAVTGASAASASRIAGSPMSPPCTMRSQPRKAASASGRSRPCVSEMRPMRAIGACRQRPRGRELNGEGAWGAASCDASASP